MRFPKTRRRTWILPLFFLAVSCVNGGDDPPGEPKNPKNLYGTFHVSLETSFSEAYTVISGRVYDGPAPSPVRMQEETASGACRLLKPVAPFCDPGCGSSALCVSDGVCQGFPKSLGVGKVTVRGVKTTTAAGSFLMSPFLNNYQAPAEVTLQYPPFVEGDLVTFSAAGDTGAPAFTLKARGIKALEILNDSIILADGQPLHVQWAPAGNPEASTISVRVDISHHGGLKGVIECETPDNGELQIAAALVDQLKGLGISGFPRLEATRKAVSVPASGNVGLVLESKVSKEVHIPGVVSCLEDEQCPSGQTCRQDARCE